jgi:hypothetical protein
MLVLDEWVFLTKRHTRVFVVLLVEELVLDSHGLLHNASNSINTIVVDRLILIRCLIHCKMVEDVFLISLINE